MANVNLAFEIPEGVLIENAAGYFSGVGAPDFQAPVGSLYLRTDGTQYVKVLDGTGTDKWTLQVSSSANNGLQMRIVPSDGQTYSIDTNFESVILRRGYINGRLVVKGRLSILF